MKQKSKELTKSIIRYEIDWVSEYATSCEVCMQGLFPEDVPVLLAIYTYPQSKTVHAILSLLHGDCAENGRILENIADKHFCLPEELGVVRRMSVPDVVDAWVMESLIIHVNDLIDRAVIFVDKLSKGVD